MKALSKLFFFLVVALMFASCATTGQKFSELAPSITNLSPGTGRIYLYRKSIMGAAIQPEVKLNGNVIGKAVPNGFFYVDKEPGNYEIMCSTEVKRKLSLTLEKGQMRYVRLSISIGFFVGHVFPELVESQVGKKEIQNCRYIGQGK